MDIEAIRAQVETDKKECLICNPRDSLLNEFFHRLVLAFHRNHTERSDLLARIAELEAENERLFEEVIDSGDEVRLLIHQRNLAGDKRMELEAALAAANAVIERVRVEADRPTYFAALRRIAALLPTDEEATNG